MVAKRSLTQRDIARIAGVSQSAVSFVLNGKADEQLLAKATQDRIRAVIEEFGYVPNINGRSLRGGKNRLIGVHTYEPVFPVLPDDYYHDYLVGIETHAAACGQDLVLFASTQTTDGSRKIYGPTGNRLHLADGTIMLGLEQNNEELERLAAEGYPFVFIGRRDLANGSAPYVTVDYAEGVASLVDKLVEMGHRQIAYIAEAHRTQPLDERLSGFTSRVAHHGDIRPTVNLVDPVSAPVAILRYLVSRGISAILIETVALLGPVADAAQQLGIAIPSNVSAVLLDRPSDTAIAISHLGMPRRALGARAVGVLLELLDGLIGPDYSELLPCGPANLETILPRRAPRRVTGSA